MKAPSTEFRRIPPNEMRAASPYVTSSDEVPEEFVRANFEARAFLRLERRPP
jgi:hypothetical protein